MNKFVKILRIKSRFSNWLFIFFAILIAIPFLIIYDFKSLARILGITVLLILCIALWYWQAQTIRSRSSKTRIRLNLNDKYWLNNHIQFYSKLTKADKIIFEDRIGLFLADIIITEIGKNTPEKSTCLYVTSSAVIAFWGLPYWNYGSLSEVLVYPENFTVNNELDKRGLVQGKVHHGGLMDSTMILSLPALIHSFSINDGRNVGIHEFAHLLDKADGVIDGLPFMFDVEERKLWARLVEKELRKKNPEPKINPYAYHSEVEFFAVLMETYRENPNRLKKRFPELFEILEENFTVS